jgi:hypothetical protein
MIKLLHAVSVIILMTLSFEVGAERFFRGSADASAAVALDDNRFIVSDDEDNVLRIYDFNCPNTEPIRQIDLSSELEVEDDSPETDIEGATCLNNRIFWITSHGRSKKGNFRESRHRFFAISISPGGDVTVDGVYADLTKDLIQYDRKWNLGLKKAIGVDNDHINPEKVKELAPKVNGLNIEGLCTTADGKKMLIGLRNPRPRVNRRQMALIIPLANPEAVVLDGADAILEPPILIDLDSLGIRSMEYSKTLDTYLIVAGSHKGGSAKSSFVLYACDLHNRQPKKLTAFADFSPEALFQFPTQSDIILLSDDGSHLIDTPQGPVENKSLPRPQRTFRARTVKP